MDADSLTREMIIAWALNYASSEELETTAKAIYAIYAEANPKRRRLSDVKKNKHYPLGYRKHEPPIKQNKTIPYTEIRK